jgi:hypothetical protein
MMPTVQIINAIEPMHTTKNPKVVTIFSVIDSSWFIWFLKSFIKLFMLHQARLP